MQFSIAKKILKLRRSLKQNVALIFALSGATVFFVFCIWYWFLKPDVESAIARFQSKPSRASADALVRLIDNGNVTPDDGERILKLLFWPRVTVRNPYRLGEKPFVGIEYPFAYGPFERSVLIWCETLRRGKHSESYGNFMRSSVMGPEDELNVSPRLRPFVGLIPESAGIYKMEIVCVFSTIRSSYWPYILNRIRGRRGLIAVNKPFYQCSFTVPVEIVVEDKAEDDRALDDFDIEIERDD
jgi:hypothetical protein